MQTFWSHKMCLLWEGYFPYLIQIDVSDNTLKNHWHLTSDLAYFFSVFWTFLDFAIIDQINASLVSIRSFIQKQSKNQMDNLL